MTAVLKDMLVREAHALGFDAVRVTLPQSTSAAGERFASLSKPAGMATWAGWRRNAERRRSPTALWPDVRSIVMLGMSYAPEANPLDALDRTTHGVISVYAQGKDYHDILKGKLKQLASRLASDAARTSKSSSTPRR